MSRHVVVIGAGASGTAAAWAASQASARVTVIVGRPGATSLSSGALDGEIGIDSPRAFVEALGIWEVGECRVATCSGLIRSSGGHDLAILDLQKVESGVIAVVDVQRRGWDARGLAESWTREPWAIERGLRFEPAPVEALRHAGEDLTPFVDLAERHDDSARVGWLGDRLRESTSLRDKRGVVMGPWLGLRPGVALELTRALGKPVGEPLSVPGGAAGLRFDRARDALLAKLGVERVDEWAIDVRADETRASVGLESGARIEGDSIVMALGGLAGGGIEWTPLTALSGFATSLAQPAALALGGRPLHSSGSPEGALFEKFSWRSDSASGFGIERVGIWADIGQHALTEDGTPAPRLYVTGDAVADAPRNLLAAIRSGLAAGARAAR